MDYEEALPKHSFLILHLPVQLYVLTTQRKTKVRHVFHVLPSAKLLLGGRISVWYKMVCLVLVILTGCCPNNSWGISKAHPRDILLESNGYETLFPKNAVCLQHLWNHISSLQEGETRVLNLFVSNVRCYPTSFLYVRIYLVWPFSMSIIISCLDVVKLISQYDVKLQAKLLGDFESTS